MPDEVTTQSGFEELAGLVVQLKDQVKEMAEGKVDESTVRAIAEEAMATSRRVGVKDSGPGYLPEDLVDEQIGTRGKLARLSAEARFEYILQGDPRRVAPMLRRSVDCVESFQKAADELILLSAMTKKPVQELDFFDDVYAPLRDAAMDTKTVGEGKEFLAPPELSGQTIETLAGQLFVLGLFPTITMPTNPFEFPTKGPRRNLAILAEALEAGTPKAKQLLPGTPSKITMTATKFAGEIVTSKELEEDAAIAILPFLQSEMLEWLAYDLEDATINGDSTAPHIDSGVAADSPKMGWDGLRVLTPTGAKFDNGGSALGLNGALQARAKMGRYGLSPQDVIWIVSVPTLYALLAIDKLTTIDKYGSGATILTGEIGRLWGSPVIASDLIPVTCDATGVIPASPGVLTIALCVNRNGFMHGVRRNTTVQILTELYAESDQDAVLLTTRQAFTARWPGQPASALVYNVATTIPTVT